MAPAHKLDSPVELPNRRSTTILPGALLPSTPAHTETRKREFIKYGSPYEQLDRLFVGLSHTWRGIDAIEFKDGSPIGYISHYSFEEKEIAVDRLSQVSHPALLMVQEIFIARGNVYFYYGQWGITLREIEELRPVFQLNEVEVALVCKTLLEGLRYLHKDLNICYGNLRSENVIITQGGNVKITGIGEALLRKPQSSVFNKAKDVQAICNVARRLLGLEESTRVRGTLGLLAEDFAGAPPTATADDLLQHPFLQVRAVPWCLSPIHTLCTIARDRKREMESS